MPETPYFVIDEEKMVNNIHRMSEIANANYVALRPHVKTHKIPEIAKRQLAAGAAGITVAKVSEAEVMRAQGIDDIFIAYPLVVESKIERAIALAKDITLTLGVDSLTGARKLSEVAARHGETLHVRLEVDTGLQRTGIRYEDAMSLAVEIDSLEAIELTGIYTYRGSLVDGAPSLDRARAGHQEGTLMANLAERIRECGIALKDVSVGSTPTAEYVAQVPGVTEIRPGTYVFSDRMQAAFGVGSLADCAGRVVTTVVSRPSEDLVIVDGGSKTFATDVQPGVPPLYLRGFGVVCDYPEAVFERMTEEHGMIRIPPEAGIAVGDRLEIIPNHICSTVNLHNYAYLSRSNALERMAISARGKLD
ncbi:alanine racemase [Alicyclobacillus fastidiosus]|uniref:Alanine racemase n=1 Tax=Alicyclobacillus fastidiosus TaxID=392011 RepID=A0ABV5AEL9_9BACL|nr:alanine racemase [Alicyclobacillus fastidiosus]WEH09819.1 alanine racemase [Alicyclobacillus fastidiosus]